MTTLVLAEKTARQKLRDPISLALGVLTAPAFVVAYGLFFAGERAFEAYVPGLLVFSIIMVTFSSAIGLSREVESGAALRLALTPAPTAAVLAGAGLVEAAAGAISLALSLLTAAALGFEPRGAWLALLGLGALGSTASIGLGWLAASVSPSSLRAFLVASVVMFLLLLFSGVVFPRPEAPLFTAGAYTIGLFDVLPTTHLHVALGSVVEGAPWSALAARVGALALLSAAYLAGGVFAFTRAERWRPGRA
jgi:ABC-2 type transport system permease protein